MSYKQKSYKKFVATAATATLVASAIVPVASASFSDVSENNEFSTYIDTAVEAGYVKGYADGTFGINNDLTRSQVVIIIGRYLEKLGYTSENTTSPWSDVTSEEVIKYGNIVKDAEVFTGYADGTLKGAGFISRENMAVVLDRLAKAVTGTSLSEVAADIEDITVADLATANANYQESIQALRDLGISTAANFNPKGNVKRGQFAKFIVTAVEKIDAIEVTPEVTAEDIAKEIAAVDATLPTLEAVTATDLAKTATAKETLASIKETIANAEFTALEKAGLEAAIAKVEASIKAIEDKATPLAFTNAIATAVASVSKEVTAENATTVKAAATAATAQLDVIAEQVKASTNVTGAQKLVFAKEITDAKTAMEAVAKKADQAIENAQDLAVASVEAVNAKEIKVVFNKAIVDSVDNLKGITVKPTGGTALTATPVLQKDGKTVILTTETALTQTTGYDVTVTTDVKTVDGKKLKENSVTTFQFNDTVKPTVSGIKVLENGKVEVTFSEKVNDAAAFYLNGVEVTTSATQDPANKAVYTLDVAAFKLAANSTNQLIVTTAKDLAGNTMSIYTGSFNYSYTVTAPSVKEITAKDEKTLALEFTKDVTPLVATNVTVAFNGTNLVAADYKLVKVENSATKYTITLTEAGIKKVYADKATQATLTVTVEGYKDTLTPANLGLKVVQSVVIAKDTVKPTLEGSVVYTPAAGTATATFAKDVKPGTLVGNVYVLDTKTGVRHEVATTAGAGKLSVKFADKKLVITNGTSAKRALENGSYQLVIEKDTFTDSTVSTNKNDKIVTAFTVVNEVASTDEATVSSVAYASVTDNNTIKVTFDKAVDVTATDLANYAVGGNKLTAGTITLSADKKVATIVLPEGYFTTSSSQVVTVSNVKTVDGVVMKAAYEQILAVKDNKKPVVTAAQVVDGKVVVTFSENVVATDFTTGIDETDFEFLVNGVVATFTLVKPTDAKTPTQLTFTTNVNLETASTITLEVKETTKGTDFAGNVLTAGTELKIK